MPISRNLLIIFFSLFAINGFAQQSNREGRAVWTKEQANKWYSQQPWLVGANFIPSTAINELEMWQAASFDTATISRELRWAAAIGMNTMRVFLHDLAYQQDPQGFIRRINIFLQIAHRYHIKPLFVLFDSCWDPYPHTGKQHQPAPFLHNSGWVQSPGADALNDPSQYPRLEKYVKGIVSHFSRDQRILGWDIWNEPDNTNNSSYGRFEPYNKAELVESLLGKAFAWARSASPNQPLTAGVWSGKWSDDDSLRSIERLMLEQSDIISFHYYGHPEQLEKRIHWLQRYQRPIFCTEYMSRPNGSTFEGSLPVAKRYKVAAFNWGLVSGKTQTIYPWDSWQVKYYAEPPLWFHDVFRKDGTPYKSSETDFIRSITSDTK